MKKLMLAAMAAVILVSCDNAGTKKKGSTELETQMDSVSYALGLDIGNSFAQAGFDSLNEHIMAAAIRDAIDSNDIKFTPEQAQAIIEDFVVQFRAARLDKNLKASREFLKENRKSKTVKETESGLQYTVIEEGTGPQPQPTDTIVFHYVEAITDGTKIRDSRDGGTPIKVSMENPNLYRAWKEAFPMMKEGAKWKIWAPSDLAFGEAGQGEIEGNQVVVFEIELLEVVAPKQ